ncbi:MAG: phosphotransferase [Ornithinimicrobium sp.]
MGTAGRPAAEVHIDTDLVRSLVRQQHADLADRPVRHRGGGWDNEVYTLGEEYAVRLLRRELAALLVRRKLRWLPTLAELLPLPIPAPVRAGAAGAGFPWSWSITPWLGGEPAAVTPPLETADAARVLGEFVAALGVAAAQSTSQPLPRSAADPASHQRSPAY